jgi:hypothetical protein
MLASVIEAALNEYLLRTGLTVDITDVRKVRRLTVNWLRHTMYSYDALLDGCTSEEQKFEVRKKILSSIAEVYPELCEECERQLEN